MLKKCCKCLVTKDLSCFYKRSDRKSVGSYCKECLSKQRRNNNSYMRDYMRKKRKENPDYLLKANKTNKKHREDNKNNPEYKLKRKQYYLTQCKTHKKEQNARSLARYYVKTGKLKKGRCRVCLSVNVEIHHEDYNKPLDVIWLCRKHHAELHRLKRYQ